MNAEWFQKNKITSAQDKFIYTAWWNHQAGVRHKKDLNKVTAKQIKVSEKSLDTEAREWMARGDIKSLQEMFGDSCHRKFLPIATIPEYLLTEDDIKTGYYDSLDKNEALFIDYSSLPVDIMKLDGLKFGDYEIRVPKTTHEVLRGGYLAVNCMGALGSMRMREFMEDPQKYLAKFDYIDAHVLMGGKLVGCIAVENILLQLAGQKARNCHYGLFINYSNTGNKEMEKELTSVINKALGINNPVIKLSVDRPVKVSREYKERKTINIFIDWKKILKSKKKLSKNDKIY